MKKIQKLMLTILALIVMPNIVSASYPLIIDTDAGWDDWIAISYIIKKIETDNKYHIKGIVVNGVGGAHLKPGIANIRKIISLATRSHIPVYAGLSKALSYNHSFPTDFRDCIDNLFDIRIPSVTTNNTELDGKTFLTAQLSNCNQKVNILAIGGLTDIAEVIRDKPKLSNNINHLFVMGGVIDEFFVDPKRQKPAGNIQGFQPSKFPYNTSAEWNFFIDPLAADIVLKQIKNITLIPLNVTKFVPLTKEFVTEFERRCQNDLASFVSKVLKHRFNLSQRGKYKEYFYDPLSAVIALGNEDKITFKEYPLYVETHGKYTLGTLYRSQTGNKVRIALKADPNLFYEEMMRVLCK
jgi:inosine-uridine nucleoside N-ribohydrolase